MEAAAEEVVVVAVAVHTDGFHGDRVFQEEAYEDAVVVDDADVAVVEAVDDVDNDQLPKSHGFVVLVGYQHRRLLRPKNLHHDHHQHEPPLKKFVVIAVDFSSFHCFRYHQVG